jgi:hypothetical protein
MTPEEAIQRIRNHNEHHSKKERFAIHITEALNMGISALEKQIPKKPYKVKDHKQNDYYCTVCKRYLGDEMELKYACLQPRYCEHCGQALDWSEEE